MTVRRFFVLCFLAIALPGTTLAWVYPEHRRIALLAIQKLKPEHRAILDRLWAEARTGYEGRLTESVIDVGQGLHPTHIDYAAWAGISGDHSCSPKDMLDIVLTSDWILNVPHVAAQLEVDIKASTHRMEQVEEICENIVLINKGSVILNGSVKDIKNQFNENIYRIDFEGKLPPDFSAQATVSDRKSGSVTVKMAEGQPPNVLLKFFLDKGIEIHAFNEILPSLNEIFIGRVGASNEAAQ